MESPDNVQRALLRSQDCWARAAKNVEAVQGLCGTHLQHVSLSASKVAGSAFSHFQRRQAQLHKSPVEPRILLCSECCLYMCTGGQPSLQLDLQDLVRALLGKIKSLKE